MPSPVSGLSAFPVWITASRPSGLRSSRVEFRPLGYARPPMKRGIALLALLVAAASPGRALSAPSSCQQVLRQGIARHVYDLSYVSSPLVIHRVLCSKTAAVPRRGRSLSLFSGSLVVSRADLRGLRELVCEDVTPARAAELAGELEAMLPDWVEADFERCRALEESGAFLDVQAGQRGFLPIASFQIWPGPGRSLEGVSSDPPDAFACELHPPDPLLNPFTDWPLLGECTATEEALESPRRLSFDFDTGSIAFEFAGVSPDRSIAFDPDTFPSNRRVRRPVKIQNCSRYQGNKTILECSTGAAYQTCLAELAAGNLRDCRAEIPPNVNPAFEYQEAEILAGYALSTSSTAEIAVTKGQRGLGAMEGGGTYTVDLPAPPVLPPATGCDPSCPAFLCGPNPCNRDCVQADGRTEYISGDLGGIFLFADLDEPSCHAPVYGLVSLLPSDRYRAYEACRRDAAWGSQTTIPIVVDAGRLYQFNDPSASLSGSTWTYTNTAELVYHYVKVEIPVSVTCNP